MRQADKLIIIQRILAQTADGNPHAALKVAVELGLRTVFLFKIGQEMCRSRGQLEFLCTPLKAAPTRNHLFLGRLVLELDKRRRHMTVRAGNAQALRGNHRNNHRHVRGHAVCRVVGANRALQLCIAFLERTDFILLHINRTEDKINLGRNLLCVRRCIIHHHVSVLCRHFGFHFPATLARFCIGLALVATGCCQCNDIEPRMVLQKKRKPLTDHAGRAYNAYIILSHFYNPPKN